MSRLGQGDIRLVAFGLASALSLDTDHMAITDDPVLVFDPDQTYDRGQGEDPYGHLPVAVAYR